MERVITTCLISLSAMALSCSNFKESHYFKSVDPKGDPVNYYRLTVRGHTQLASARYLSGYFDEDAVNAYFNEFTQPEKGRVQPVASGTGEKVASLSESLEGRSLVLLLSSNSDDIAAQIGALSKDQQMVDAVARLVHQDKFTAAHKAQATLTLQQTRTRILAQQGEKLIGQLDPATVTREQVEKVILDYANALAAELGSDRPFGSLNEAHQWLAFNRARLIKE